MNTVQLVLLLRVVKREKSASFFKVQKDNRDRAATISWTELWTLGLHNNAHPLCPFYMHCAVLYSRIVVQIN